METDKKKIKKLSNPSGMIEQIKIDMEKFHFHSAAR